MLAPYKQEVARSSRAPPIVTTPLGKRTFCHRAGAVADLAAALESVRELGGAIIHPGDQWAVCRDSEGSPFALAAAP